MIEWFLGMFFILGKFWSFIIGGHVDVARLLVSTTNRTYNHNTWNIISNIHFLLLNYFYYISILHLFIIKLCFTIFPTSWNM
jgi:hypothetical protein